MTPSLTFADLAHHLAVQRLATLLRLAFQPSPWRAQRLRQVPLDALRATLQRLPLPHEAQRFATTLTDILHALATADPRLRLPEDDLAWILARLDTAEAPTLAVLLLALSTTQDVGVTLDDLAQATGEPVSTWRERCQRGDVPGAHKPQRDWVIPAGVAIHFLLPAAQAQRLQDQLNRQRQDGDRAESGAAN